MSKRKRTVIVIAAWGGWVASALITAAVLVFEEAANPFFGRLFALLGLGSAVLTVVSMLERSSLRHPPATVAHTLGFQQGWEARGVMFPDHLPPITLGSPWAEEPGDSHEKADTGPIGRLSI